MKRLLVPIGFSMFISPAAFAACGEVNVNRLLDAGATPDQILQILQLCSTANGIVQATNTTPPAKTPVAKAPAAASSPAKSPPAKAPDPKTPDAPSPVASDGEKLTPTPPKPTENWSSIVPPTKIDGDVVRAKVNIPGFNLVAADNGKPMGNFTAPKGSEFHVTRDVLEKGTGNDGEEKLYVFFKHVGDQNEAINGDVVNENNEYVFNKNDLQAYDHAKVGLTYGLLAVPYKYQFKDHSLTGAVTVGPYFGTGIDVSGFNVKVIGAAGLSVLPVSTQQNGVTSTANKAGFSAATGVIATVKDNFNMGFLVGFDWVGPNSGYQYDGKPWMALNLGYSFSN